jgi:hypothetical protein
VHQRVEAVQVDQLPGQIGRVSKIENHGDGGLQPGAQLGEACGVPADSQHMIAAVGRSAYHGGADPAARARNQYRACHRSIVPCRRHGCC